MASKLSPKPPTVAPGRITPDTGVPGITKRGVLLLFVVVVSHVTGEKSETVVVVVSTMRTEGVLKVVVLEGPLKNRYFWFWFWLLLSMVLVDGGPDSPPIVLVVVFVVVLGLTHAACAVCGLTIAPAKIPVANTVLASRSALVAPHFRPSARALPGIIRNMGPPQNARLNVESE